LTKFFPDGPDGRLHRAYLAGVVSDSTAMNGLRPVGPRSPGCGAVGFVGQYRTK